MPIRSLTVIRKDVTRLWALIDREKAAHPALAAVAPTIAAHVAAIDSANRIVTEIAVRAARERDERDDATSRLLKWVRTWRPATLAIVPGAAASLRELPSGRGSPDDVVRTAADLRAFLESDPNAEPLRVAALTELGTLLDTAGTEISEATLALAQEAAARESYANAARAANDALVHTLAIVRTLFGATSPQYKQFIASSRADSDDEPESPVPTAE